MREGEEAKRHSLTKEKTTTTATNNLHKKPTSQKNYENKQGVYIPALFGASGGSGEVGQKIRAMDVDGDGYLNKSEFRNSIVKLIKKTTQTNQLKKAVIALVVLLILMSVMIVGMVTVVIVSVKDTSTNEDGVMRAKPQGTGEDLGRVVAVARKKEAVSMSSCMNDEYFDELQEFKISQNLAKLSIKVDGFARVPKAGSMYGTVVVLLTPVGRITLDGKILEFNSDVGDIFADAGLAVAGSGRRLASVFELAAILDRIPMGEYGCYNAKEQGPPPSFPRRFVAEQEVYQPCVVHKASNPIWSFNNPILGMAMDGDAVGQKNLCSQMNVDSKPETTTTLIDGQEMMVGYEREYVDLDKQFSRSEFYLPARSRTHKLVRITNHATKTAVTFMAPAVNDTITDMSVGFFCQTAEPSKAVPGVIITDIREQKESISFKESTKDGKTGLRTRHFDLSSYGGLVLSRLTDVETSKDEFKMHSITSVDTMKKATLQHIKINKLDDMSATGAAPFPVGIFDVPGNCHTDGAGKINLGNAILTEAPFVDADTALISRINYQISAGLRNATSLKRTNVRVASSTGRNPEGSKAWLTQDVPVEEPDYRRKLLALTSHCSGDVQNKTYSVPSPLNLQVGARFADSKLCQVQMDMMLDSFEVSSAPGLKVEGNIYMDWNAEDFKEGWDAASCVKVTSDMTVWPYNIKLDGVTQCMSGGEEKDANGCLRPYLLFSQPVRADMGSKGGVDGSMNVKFYLPGTECDGMSVFTYFEGEVKYAPCAFCKMITDYVVREIQNPTWTNPGFKIMSTF